MILSVCDQVGVVESSGYASIKILQEEWAPGIWTGVKNCIVAIKPADSEFYKCYINVTYCDLENRTIYHQVNELGPYDIKAGDRLYLTIKVEDER
jgi:hypothetical protein